MWKLTDRHLNSSGMEKAGYKLLLLDWTGIGDWTGLFRSEGGSGACLLF